MRSGRRDAIVSIVEGDVVVLELAPACSGCEGCAGRCRALRFIESPQRPLKLPRRLFEVEPRPGQSVSIEAAPRSVLMMAWSTYGGALAGLLGGAGLASALAGRLGASADLWALLGALVGALLGWTLLDGARRTFPIRIRITH